jgi:GT2 family glycosyltransferase
MLSVIIITLNSIKFIEACLESLFTQDYRDFEVIVVDNGSRDDTAELVRERYPDVAVIQNERNLGAAKARNQGIEIAKGEWVVTLDCDTVLEKNFLTSIAARISTASEDTGMIQPKILQSDKKTIYSCGIHLSGLKRFYDIGKGKKDSRYFNNVKPIFGPCSAAAAYKMKMLEDIKENYYYFDEAFFFLVEDVDLSLRAQHKGWKAVFYPKAICYHYGNSSYSTKPYRQYLCWRNRRFLLKKLRLNRLKSFIIFVLYDVPRLLFLLLGNKYVRNELKNGIINSFHMNPVS